jgi:hypothetical protein
MAIRPADHGVVASAGGGIYEYSTTGSPTVTTHGIYTSLTYTGSGSFTILSNPNALTFDLLLVAGGGSGNSGYQTTTSSMFGGGGGGAGGMKVLTGQTLAVQAHTVTVFAGGAAPATGSSSWGSDGSGGTAITGHTVTGGGLGGNNSQYGTVAGPNVGGSGGGAGPTQWNSTSSGAAGTSGEGNAGGNGWGYYVYGNVGYTSGGGGGKGAVGNDGAQTSDPGYSGDGGAGLANNYSTGSNITYAAGGGGGSHYYQYNPTGKSGAPGDSSAGTGGSYFGWPVNYGVKRMSIDAAANRGGGGGGAMWDAYSINNLDSSSDGGSGIVVIRWVTPV